MSIIDRVKSLTRSSREEQLEKRIELLELHLLKVSQTLKSVAELSVRLGREVDTLTKLIKSSHRQGPAPVSGPPEDDFYN